MIHFAIIVDTLCSNANAGCACRSFVCAFILSKATGVAGCDGTLTGISSRPSLIITALPLSRQNGLVIRRLGGSLGLRIHLGRVQRGGCAKLAATPRHSCQHRGARSHGQIVIASHKIIITSATPHSHPQGRQVLYFRQHHVRRKPQDTFEIIQCMS